MDKLTFRPISSQPISLAKSKKQSVSVSGQGFQSASPTSSCTYKW